MNQKESYLRDLAQKKKFLRHGEIECNVSIEIDRLFDTNEVLGVNKVSTPLSYAPHLERLMEEQPMLKRGLEHLNISMTKLAHEDSIFRNSGKSTNKNTNINIPPVKNYNKKDTRESTKTRKTPKPQEDHLKRGVIQSRVRPLAECSLLIVAYLSINGQQVGPPIFSSHIRNFSFTQKIIFRLKYRDLSPISVIGITIYDMNQDVNQSLLGSTTIDLFNQKKCLRQGHYSLYIHKNMEVDLKHPTTTPGLIDDLAAKEINVLGNYIHQYNTENSDRQRQRHSPWLDHLAYENISEKQKILHSNANFASLQITLPHFGYPVLLMESKCHLEKLFQTPDSWEREIGMVRRYEEKQGIDIISSTPTGASTHDMDKSKLFAGCIRIYDSTVMKTEDFTKISNPITHKYYQLIRNVDDSIAKELKPNNLELEDINKCIKYPEFMKMSDKDQGLLWRFRYSLIENGKALPKVLLSADWSKPSDEKEALNLLTQWAEIYIEQALPMLSSLFCANEYYNKGNKHYQAFKPIREHAVKSLEKLTDKELIFILLQLVQAYKYEDYEDSHLKTFLINKAVKNMEVAVYLHWQLNLEKDNPRNETLASTYQGFYNEFFDELGRDEGNNNIILKEIGKQCEFHKHIMNLAKIVKSKKKIEDMKKTLGKAVRGEENHQKLTQMASVSLPVDPRVKVKGISDKDYIIFKSATKPIKLTLTVDEKYIEYNNNSELYHLIYKDVDDMRQDQLVLQVITLIDHLLQNVNQKLEFTTYKVVATSVNDGFMEFVPRSKTIYAILQEHHDRIQDYFEKNSHGDSARRDMIMDNYIKSCAGYCAVTNVLAIGDRHLENLLITEEGRFFHIDFGYILGKNPRGKLPPPPIRICKEMIDCMGGRDSENYKKFRMLCRDSFIWLRSHRKYIANLFHLMIHSGIADIEAGVDETSMITRLYEKFMPEKNKQEAERHFLRIIDESANAFFIQVNEKFHAWANYWKK